VDRGPRRTSAPFLYISNGDARSAWYEQVASSSIRVGWRVIAANNRPLGRSAEAFASLAECVTAATRLHREVAQAASSVLFDIADGHWQWTVLLADEPVAVCVHSYKRRVECERALRQFLEAVAEIEPAADEVRRLGPNALRAYDRPPPPLVETSELSPLRTRPALRVAAP
jgi:hypothetical protein